MQFLDIQGLRQVWDKINTSFLPLSGGTMDLEGRDVTISFKRGYTSDGTSRNFPKITLYDDEKKKHMEITNDNISFYYFNNYSTKQMTSIGCANIQLYDSGRVTLSGRDGITTTLPITQTYHNGNNVFDHQYSLTLKEGELKYAYSHLTESGGTDTSVRIYTENGKLILWDTLVTNAGGRTTISPYDIIINGQSVIPSALTEEEIAEILI